MRASSPTDARSRRRSRAPIRLRTSPCCAPMTPSWRPPVRRREPAARRPAGRRDRQSPRLRRVGHGRRGVGARTLAADARRTGCGERDPDGRGAESGELRRRARGRPRPGHRHQHRGRRNRTGSVRAHQRHDEADRRRADARGQVPPRIPRHRGRLAPARHVSPPARAAGAAWRWWRSSKAARPPWPACAPRTSILRLDGMDVSGVDDVQRLLTDDAIGKRVEATVVRGDRTITLALVPTEARRLAKSSNSPRMPSCPGPIVTRQVGRRDRTRARLPRRPRDRDVHPPDGRDGAPPDGPLRRADEPPRRRRP